MDDQRTMEFMMAEQARFQARSEAARAPFDANIAPLEAADARASRRLDRVERVLTQTNRGWHAFSGAAIGSNRTTGLP